MFGLPSLQAIIAMFVVPILIVCAMVNYRETVWNILTLITVSIIEVIVASGYFPYMYDTWKYDKPENKPQTKPDYQVPEVKQYHNLNSQGFASTFLRIKIDSVRLFNRDLLVQKHGGLEIKMQEDYWVKKKDGAELSNWQKIGGVGKGDWQDMILRGIEWGAYKEIGGQGKRVPADWNKIRRLERGEPLPRLRKM